MKLYRPLRDWMHEHRETIAVLLVILSGIAIGTGLAGIVIAFLSIWHVW
jgi:hypothetical protein